MGILMVLFGLEKDQGFRSALGAIYQTLGGEELYPMSCAPAGTGIPW